MAQGGFHRTVTFELTISSMLSSPYRTDIDLAWTAAMLGRRDEGRQRRPFSIGQIDGLAEDRLTDWA
jgi:hypothetical protein